jgi:carbon storage regulator CsrA
MLVLSRKPTERIIITAPDGTRIELLFMYVRKEIVRMAITAPVAYTIHRGEVQDKIDAEAVK